jgi:histidinol-phosphate aminotransferase
MRAVQEAAASDLSCYPSPTGRSLRLALADWLGVQPEEICVGCGSEELIDCAFRALCETDGSVAHIAPTFVMARLFAAMNELNPVAVPLTRDLDADTEALLHSGADLLYLCTPNNPTGAELRPDTVRGIIERFPGPVVIDEAYAEFATHSFVREAVDSGRVVVLRTFSNAWGLAGLRVGYAVGPRDLVAAIETIRAPFKLSGLGERAAVAALQSDGEWMRQGVADTIALRERFTRALQSAGYSPIPSSTNFVLVPVPDASAARTALLARGVSVRPFPSLPVVGDAIRVSIGPWDALHRVVEVLTERRA